MTRLPRRLSPDLKVTHPGFYRVSQALVVLHASLAFDDLRPAAGKLHHGGAWEGVIAAFPIQVWGVLHLLCIALVSVGLFATFTIARLGFLLSLLVLSGLSGAFLYGAFLPGATATGFSFCLFATLVCSAAFREPRAVVRLDEDFLNGA